jgi:hypothetical protein
MAIEKRLMAIEKRLIKVHRPSVNEGGKGLEGALKGMQAGSGQYSLAVIFQGGEGLSKAVASEAGVTLHGLP